MKKLLLILTVVCVSVTSWADINPYAYGLSSSLSADKQTLTFTYYLNADAHNDGQGGKPDGVQIYLVNKATGRRVGSAVTNGGIKQGRNTASCSTADLPKNVELTWEVVVHGNSPSSPTIARTLPTFQPVSVHGIAVDNDHNSPNFGKIFITESSASRPDGYSWIDANYQRSVIEYDPATMYQSGVLVATLKAHQKKYQAYASTTNFSNPDPHRVRISNDGRIFVTSYSTGGDVAVWEYKGNGRYDRLITKNTSQRVVAMDVKGSGSNLKLIVVEVINNKGTYNSQNYAQLVCREFSIGVTSNSRSLNTGTVKLYYNDYRTSSTSAGMIYQNSTWTVNNRQHDCINVAYGKDNDVWLKMDFESGSVNHVRIVCFDGTNNGANVYDYNGRTNTSGIVGTTITSGGTSENFSNNTATGHRGGEGIFIKNDTLITAKRNLICFYQITENKTLTSLKEISDKFNNVSAVINRANAWAIDYANNLYVVSNHAYNISAIALPYTSPVITRAPKEDTHVLADPVPNIYATNLRYEPKAGTDKYIFSFNANTTPKYAEIRFYKSYESMKQSMAVVNADDFQGNQNSRLNDDNLVCYYPITSGLKQGKNEVEFRIVGAVIENKLLTNACLPPGELYWSVYVETDRSSVFAPIYRQPMTDTHYHMHAVVNDNPETDQFGTIYGVQEDKRSSSSNQSSSLMVYEINDNGSDDHDINNTTRYTKKKEYFYGTSNAVKAKPRRMAIAPDGTLFMAHEGVDNEQPMNQVAIYSHGGVYTWNPNDPVDENNKIKLTLFSTNEINTSSSVALFGHVNGMDTTWKVYAANTYNEYASHDDGQSYTEENQNNIDKPANLEGHTGFGWNGFLQFQKDEDKTWNTWSNPDIDRAYTLGRGDASGNVSLVTMEKGVWMCQHREHCVAVKVAVGETHADNLGAYVLSFIPYGTDERKWRSCTNDGGRVKIKGTITHDDAVEPSLNSQKDDSPLQSAPGGGMAARKINGDDYLYVVNQDGNILQIKLVWEGNKPIVYTHYHGDVCNIKILKTPEATKGVLNVQQNGKTTTWKTAAISSMCFDYAGNLVTTTGVRYLKIGETLKTADNFGTPEGGQNIIVYTMPYDRTNAREIQAPKSCIRIAERLAYTEDAASVEPIINTYLPSGSKPGPCYVDIYRPMPNTSFSSICLPFDLDIQQIDNKELLYDAEFKQFANAMVKELGGENILELQFEDIPVVDGKQILKAYTPYIIKPQNRIAGIIEVGQPIQFVKIDPANLTTNSHDFDDDNDGINNNSITFTGVIPKQEIEVQEGKTLLLVAENRLAEMAPDKTVDSKPVGEILGFRGYFTLGAPLPKGMQAVLRNKDNTVTGLVDINGKKVNINKYLREGRVYIRVGDSLYTVDGQLVK